MRSVGFSVRQLAVHCGVRHSFVNMQTDVMGLVAYIFSEEVLHSKHLIYGFICEVNASLLLF